MTRPVLLGEFFYGEMFRLKNRQKNWRLQLVNIWLCFRNMVQNNGKNQKSDPCDASPTKDEI